MYWVSERVPAGQHEPVAAEPGRVGRVVRHDVLVEQVGDRGQAHRGAGVAVAGLLHGVGGQQRARCRPRARRGRSTWPSWPTGREMSGLRPWVGVVVRLLVVVVLTGASLAGVVHTVGTGPPSTLVSGLPRGWGSANARQG